jgi:hypothetical protein
MVHCTTSLVLPHTHNVNTRLPCDEDIVGSDLYRLNPYALGGKILMDTRPVHFTKIASDAYAYLLHCDNTSFKG